MQTNPETEKRQPGSLHPACYATFELANGETVTPCHKPKGHDGDHEGWCLDSRCVWPQGFDSEQAMNAER